LGINERDGPRELDSGEVLERLKGMELHQRISALRTRHGLTQDELGRKVNAKRGTVSGWEAPPGSKRSAVPGPQRRNALAFLFGVPAFVFTPDFGEVNERQTREPVQEERQEKERPVHGIMRIS